MIGRMLRSVKTRAAKLVINVFLTDARIAESYERQRFFFNAFKLLRFNGIDGHYFEFGCRGGRSLALAYHESRKFKHDAHLYAFDSFLGLPDKASDKDDHPVWNKGDMRSSLDGFHKHCRRRGLSPDSYTTVEGFFNESLFTKEAESLPTNVALVYIDCDMYSSTVDVFKFLQGRLKNGMIIAFDDYFCISPTQLAGERRAMLEFFDDNSEWALLPYLTFSYTGMSFIVEKKSILSD